MTGRIFRSIILVALAVLLASFGCIMGMLYDYFTDVQFDQLHSQTDLASRGISLSGIEFFRDFDTGEYRITWIDSEGHVLYDTDKNADEMENHLAREEVQEAIRSGYGDAQRYSTTLTTRMIYAAETLPDGTILRVSSKQEGAAALFIELLQPVSVVLAAALVLSAVIANAAARKIIEPLNRIDLDHPMDGEPYEELVPFLQKIHHQKRQIREQEAALRDRQDTFDAVTGSMNEGLVLLDRTGDILGLNKAARALLSADKTVVGMNILTLDRSREMVDLMAEAAAGRKGETRLEAAGRVYQVDTSPVYTDGDFAGTVMLFFDVTERSSAEQLRREFTANVSHELKTPLHTISGCAELLMHGMVREEDRDRFAGQIYTEAQRMIRLVEDILRLSRLDEGAADMAQAEPVDLLDLALQTKEWLTYAAEEAKVSLAVTGETAVICGIPQLLQGILFNLCDNGIKYNRPGGSVTMDVHTVDDEVVLRVTDTGIGIPKEHQSRIFERFYRVDKSHSREMGGTGLGLSIVKHAVKAHQGDITLESTPGEGTTITVRLPRGE